MKKLDKLILSSFIGPFILTFLVVVFILLTQHMLKYFDDILGKDIGFVVIANLMFDFSIFMTPIAIPLAVLLSSLMAFGNLGEHFELTAIKSAGISLLRTLWPIFFFVIGLSILAFYSNNYFVPKAALNAYSLLYDIKQKKPALDLKEGTFYNGIPDLSIKVNRKDPETGEIWDAIIYDHRDKNGNKKVTLADSGRMYTVLNDQYLILEMYSGHTYIEGQSNAKSVSSRNARSRAEALSRVKFDKSKIVLDLSSFDLKRTKKELFSGNRIMRNLAQLTDDMDSLRQDVLEYQLTAFTNTKSTMKYLSGERLPLSVQLKNLKNLKDSLAQAKQEKRIAEELAKEDSIAQVRKADSIARAKMFNKIDSGEKKINEPSEILASASANQLKANKSVNTKDSNKPALLNKRIKSKTPTTLSPQIKKKAINKKKQVSKQITANGDRINTKSKKKDGKSGLSDEERTEKMKTFISKTDDDKKALKATINRVRQMKSKIQNSADRIEVAILNRYVFEIQWHKIISNSFACLVMFLIGAPLGAIIKKGGLGIPVLISIFFFIVFYVLGMVGEKQAKAGLIDPILGVWMANIILLPIGLFFLRQARNDVKLFDADFYNVALDKLRMKFSKKT